MPVLQVQLACPGVLLIVWLVSKLAVCSWPFLQKLYWLTNGSCASYAEEVAGWAKSGLDEEARVNFMKVLRDTPASLEKLLEVLSLLKTCKQAENEVCPKGSSKFSVLGTMLLTSWIICPCLLGSSV